MSWTDHAIFWHVYPLGFTGAPVRPQAGAERALTPRLRHLVDWLPYAAELGVNALLLGPVFTSSTHGYDTVDHLSIDPRLGDDADFDALVAACRERGIRLVLDGVFNHVGAEHPQVRAALEGGADSDAARLLDIDFSSTPPRPRVFEGHDALVELDHGDPAAAQWVGDVMLHWLRRGIDGWRLDAAYAVPPQFWESVLLRVRAEFGDAWFVGEVIHGDYVDVVARSGLDSLTQYELWKAIWSAIVDTNFFELEWTLQRHNGFLEHFVPQTFVGNHDTTRIASQVGRDRLPVALTVLMTVGGIPSIYYGDEQGFEGVKRDELGGDDDVRPTFPAEPSDLAPWGAEVLRLHQDLIGLRRRHPWLVRARTETLEVVNEALHYRSVGAQGESIEVQLRLQPEPSVTVTAAGGEVLLQR